MAFEVVAFQMRPPEDGDSGDEPPKRGERGQMGAKEVREFLMIVIAAWLFYTGQIAH